MTLVWKFVAMLGCVILFGTAGASDLNNLPFVQTIVQCLIGFGLLVVGLRGSAVANKRRENDETHRK